MPSIHIVGAIELSQDGILYSTAPLQSGSLANSRVPVGTAVVALVLQSQRLARSFAIPYLFPN